MLSATPLLLSACLAAPTELPLTPPPGAQYRFGGVVGARLEANLHGWLLPMPDANPGLLEMFRLRDRLPKPRLEPWAGEFVGKYLISAIQATQLLDSPELVATIQRVLAELAQCQADDGYLGPWPREERLLGHWDLWGHYHLLVALLDWHQRTADPAALRVARRIGDCVCGTFLDQGKRVAAAGSAEMNMAILTGLVRLYRVTGEERYLRQAREVEHDWEAAGDYLRAGEAGTPFFQTPRPRWESLHDLQGLVELYRVTGEQRYRTAFESLWRSIRALDVHNTGGFSSGEQAVGDPYATGAIETCCTVAWLALCADMLQLTGEVAAADELERATLNAGLGAQHPSGRWWTYNTPMNGVRKASAHDIVFQARAGTPELNCCSVNGPRVLGCLVDWAVLRDAAGLTVSYYGPGTSDVALADGTRVRLTQTTRYPVDGHVALTVAPAVPRQFALRLRVPGWSRTTTVTLNGQAQPTPAAGSWIRFERRWEAGDRVTLDFDFSVRAAGGEGTCAGQLSLSRGPLLLAWDQRRTAFDEAGLPLLDAGHLGPVDLPVEAGRLAPWVAVAVGPAERRVALCDFASAGAAGTVYRSWLPGRSAGPGVFQRAQPAPGALLAPGRIVFGWVPPGRNRPVDASQRLVIGRTPDGPPVYTSRPRTPFEVVELPAGSYVWQVFRSVDGVERAAEDGLGEFTLAPGAPAQHAQVPPMLAVRADGAIIDAPLRDGPRTAFGELLEAHNVVSDGDGLVCNGRDSKLVYGFAYWPGGDYSAVARFRLDAWPDGRLAQVLSLWCAGGDDPLRVTVDARKLYARLEGAWSQPMAGVPLELHRWYRVAAVREAGALRLYVDGQLASETRCASTGGSSGTTALGVGCNPRYAGNECLPGAVAGVTLYARALRPGEW